MGKESLKIDVSKVLEAKLPKHYRFIPKCVVNWLKNTIHEDELNHLLLKNKDKQGVEFADAILRDLDIKLNIIGEQNLPAPESGRYIFVSNHPLGGLDGIALISVLGHRYGQKLKFIVNDMLMQITPFESIFLPANKTGKQSRSIAEKINDAYGGDTQIVTFPAGICSRRMPDGSISDLEWTKGFVSKSIEYKRDVVPIFFDGVNSDFFYKMAQLRVKLGIKFNYEMIYLPGELFKARGAEFSILIGKPMKLVQLAKNQSPHIVAQGMKRIVYNLEKRNFF